MTARPFFGFYGGKWRDALKHYPPPQGSTIVEPFAGSAGYSVRYCGKKVVLCEIDPVIASVWAYLVRVTPREILSIPDFPNGGSLDDLHLCQEAQWLVGFWLNRGVSSPRRSPSYWMREGKRPGSFWGERVRATIASQLHLIRHWDVRHCSYEDAPHYNEATWFVDPPYQQAGEHYKFGAGKIDYRRLALWCQLLKGQVIVCENDGADWLPFASLATTKTTRSGYKSKEAAWTNV